MNTIELIKKAKAREKIAAQKRCLDYYVNTLAWFGYLGILRHNKIKPQKTAVTLNEVLLAAKLEPRIYELLPAILVTLAEAVKINQDLPKDLHNVVTAIRLRKKLPPYQSIPPEKYMHWIQSGVFEIAKRRINYRKSARKSNKMSSTMGAFIRERRIQLAYTQKQFAEQRNVSLRVVRDLEQGKKGGSLANIEAIFAGLGATLYWK